MLQCNANEVVLRMHVRKIATTNRGFTLLELFIVITIITITTSLVVGSFNHARSKARDARRLADTRALQTALTAYHNDHDEYPKSTECSGDNAWQTGTLASALKGYLATLPTDPTNNASWTTNNRSWENDKYGYCYMSRLVDLNDATSGGHPNWKGTYFLAFRLENQNLPLDARDGVMTCANQSFDFGGNDGFVITFGSSCRR